MIAEGARSLVNSLKILFNKISILESLKPDDDEIIQPPKNEQLTKIKTKLGS